MQCPFLGTALCAIVAAAPAAAMAGDWMFRPGYYTHSPTTGRRTAQYAPLPSVAALPDTRPISSGYRRSRVILRGPAGTVDDSYRVENWGNGRGGLDAEWERFHEAWRGSYLSSGSSYGTPPYYGGGYGPGYGYGGGYTPGYGGGPGYGQGSGYGGGYGPGPGYRGGPGYGGGYGPDSGPGHGAGAGYGSGRPAGPGGHRGRAEPGRGY